MPASTLWSVSAPLSCARWALRSSASSRLGHGQRVRPEAGDAGHVVRVVDEVDGQPLLRAGLGQVEAAHRAAGEFGGEVQPKRERALARARGCRREVVPPLQPAAAGQMRHQVQARYVQIQELAVPADTGHLRPRIADIGGSNVLTR